MRRALGLLAAGAAAALAGASPALAHDCNVFINPDDCKNTAWTVGVTATVAAAAAAVTGLVRSGTKGPMPRDEGECGAELRDLDGRLNMATHAIETSIDRHNRAAMDLEQAYAMGIHTLESTGSTAGLDAARARRAQLLATIPQIRAAQTEAQTLFARRVAVYRLCASAGNLPAGTWDRPAPTWPPLFETTDYGPSNKPPWYDDWQPTAEPGTTEPRTPASHDDLVSSLTQPGVTIIDPTNAHNLGPPEFVTADGKIKIPKDAPFWATPLGGMPLPPLTIEDGTVSVRLGPAGASIAVVNDGGRIALQGTYEVPFGGGDVQDLKRLQHQLDRLNRRIRDAGLEVKGIDTSGSQIRIETGPIG